MSDSDAERYSFRKRLLGWYRARHRKLPWRGTKDPYKVLVSEIMLQQTTVQAVIPYYERWMTLFPDAASLARAPLRKILKAWQGLGYYRRAQNLRAAAKIIVNKFGGRVPADFEEISKLPGVGPYTAAAVLSIAFDKPYPVVDANVRRLMMRILAIRGEAVPKHDSAILNFLKPVISKRSPGAFNQALMEVGGRICKPRNPLCPRCPARPDCSAYREGLQEVIPRPSKIARPKRIEAVVAVVERDGRFLIRKRPEPGLLGGLWEFPGGKRRPRESRVAALRRELREEVGAPTRDETFLAKVRHAYTTFEVDLYAYRCRLEGEPDPIRGRLKWVTSKGLRYYPFPSGSAKIIRRIEEGSEA
jgi:A/G-specific adenine glycosylase